MADRACVVGSGRTGLSLGYALHRAGALESLVYHGRRPRPPAHPVFAEGIAHYRFGLGQPSAGTTVVLLTVPDDVLPEIARVLAERGPAPERCVALHCSGTLSGDVLAPLREGGYQVGALHPLQSLADPVSGAERLVGSWFSVSGEVEALAVANRLVGQLSGHSLMIPTTGQSLYHAAAVIASNYLPVLLAVATRLMVRANVAEKDAVAALISLVRGTIENIDELGFAPALTGPVARGDVETVRFHLRSLPEREAAPYRALGREAVELAEARGLDAVAAAALRGLFEAEAGRERP